MARRRTPSGAAAFGSSLAAVLLLLCLSCNADFTLFTKDITLGECGMPHSRDYHHHHPARANASERTNERTNPNLRTRSRSRYSHRDHHPGAGQ